MKRTLITIFAGLLIAACGGDEDLVGSDAAGADADAGVDPAGWSVVVSDLPAALLSIWGSAHDDLWITGADTGDGTGPWVVHGTAAGLSRVDLRPADPDGGHIWWAYGPESGDSVWLAGEQGRVFQLDRASDEVTRVETTTDATLYGIWGASGDEVWAVGGYVYPRSGPPTVVRMRAGQAAEVQQLPAELDPNVTLFKVWGTAEDDVWVVGERGTVLHWDGGAWALETLDGEPRLVTINGSGPEDVVIVGGAAQASIFERRGVGAPWADASPGPYPILNGVFVPPDGRAVAVGVLGQFMRRTAGVWQSSIDLPLLKDWHAAWVDPRGDVWVVGGNLLSANDFDAGTMLRYGPPRSDLPAGAVAGLDPVAEPEPEAVEVVEAEPDVTGDTAEVIDDTTSEETVADSEIGPVDTVAVDTSVAVDTTAPEDTAIAVDTTVIMDTSTVVDTSAALDTAVADTSDTIASEALRIGWDDMGTFVDLVAGQEIEMVEGVQGNFHLEVLLRYPYADGPDILATAMDLKANVDGLYVAWFETTAYPVHALQDGLYQSYVIPIIFPESDPTPYVDKVAVVSAEIGLPEGETRSVQVEVVLINDF